MDDLTTWQLYFVGIVSIQYHPGNKHENRLSLEEMADVVDEMLKLTKERTKCLGEL